MDGNWIRIVQDPKLRSGQTYFCKEGHSWFKTYKQLRDETDAEIWNNCPTCAGGKVAEPTR